MNSKRVVVECAIVDPTWSRELSDPTQVVDRAVAAVFKSDIVSSLDSGGVSVSVALADDDTVADLNRKFRGQTGPTNVLSFQQQCPQHDDINALGDVILAFETVQNEARNQNKTLEDHATHLLVHGVLHLLGFDHQDDKDAVEMETLEQGILRMIDVKDPYALANFANEPKATNA